MTRARHNTNTGISYKDYLGHISSTHGTSTHPLTGLAFETLTDTGGITRITKLISPIMSIFSLHSERMNEGVCTPTPLIT